MIKFFISRISWIKPLKREMKLIKNVRIFFFTNSSSINILLQFPPLMTTPPKHLTHKMLSLPPIATRASYLFHLQSPHRRISPIGSPISHCRKRVSSYKLSWKPVRFFKLCFSLDRFLSGDIRRRRLNLSTCRRLQFHILRHRRRWYLFILRLLIVGLLTRRGLCLCVRNRIRYRRPNSKGLFFTDFQPKQLRLILHNYILN